MRDTLLKEIKNYKKKYETIFTYKILEQTFFIFGESRTYEFLYISENRIQLKIKIQRHVIKDKFQIEYFCLPKVDISYINIDL
tara:strand:- start:692 stop:940 length:249 start_codon:yes stop_codon:yes gene_type:complete